MSKDIDALDSLDEYSDEEYSAYLEYTQLKDQCVIEPTTLYINEKHEFLSEWTSRSKNNKWRYANMLEIFFIICLVGMGIRLLDDIIHHFFRKK